MNVDYDRLVWVSSVDYSGVFSRARNSGLPIAKSRPYFRDGRLKKKNGKRNSIDEFDVSLFRLTRKKQ